MKLNAYTSKDVSQKNEVNIKSYYLSFKDKLEENDTRDPM